MSNEQISAGFEIVMKLIHKRFLSRAIEIDHDIPTEDQIEWVFDWEMVIHQIQATKCNRVGKVCFHFEDSGLLAEPTKKMTLDEFGRHVAKMIFVV